MIRNIFDITNVLVHRRKAAGGTWSGYYLSLDKQFFIPLASYSYASFRQGDVGGWVNSHTAHQMNQWILTISHSLNTNGQLSTDNFKFSSHTMHLWNLCV